MSEISDYFSTIDWRSMAPALGAVLLSVKNWWDLRKGAVIEPLPVVDYGLWGIKNGETRNKVFILPLSFRNEGVRDGVIVDLKVSFDSGSGFNPIEIRRKIEMTDVSDAAIQNMNLVEFRNKALVSVNPMLPVSVPSNGSVMFMVEAFDGEDAVVIDKEVTCKIELLQGNGKSQSRTFKFKISTDQFDESHNNLNWYRSSSF